MFKLVAIAVLVCTALPGGLSKHLDPRKAECGGINPVVRGEPLPSTVDPLINCQDLSAAHANSPNLTSYTCFMPLEDVEVAASVNTAKHNLTLQACVGEVVCDSAIMPPGVDDSNTLCSVIPDSVTISPYYPGAGCICAAWSLGSATYMACNCNGCYYMSFTDIIDDCATLLCWCIEEYNWGSFHRFDAENSYTTLFLQGSASYQPVPFQECV